MDIIMIQLSIILSHNGDIEENSIRLNLRPHRLL